jgi:hypothetical protein
MTRSLPAIGDLRIPPVMPATHAKQHSAAATAAAAASRLLPPTPTQQVRRGGASSSHAPRPNSQQSGTEFPEFDMVPLRERLASSDSMPDSMKTECLARLDRLDREGLGTSQSWSGLPKLDICQALNRLDRDSGPLESPDTDAGDWAERRESSTSDGCAGDKVRFAWSEPPPASYEVPAVADATQMGASSSLGASTTMAASWRRHRSLVGRSTLNLAKDGSKTVSFADSQRDALSGSCRVGDWDVFWLEKPASNQEQPRGGSSPVERAALRARAPGAAALAAAAAAQEAARRRPAPMMLLSAKEALAAQKCLEVDGPKSPASWKLKSLERISLRSVMKHHSMPNIPG